MPPSNTLQRNVLPIPDQSHVGLTTYDAKDPDTAYPPITPLLPPKGAPNVLVILLDDVGFGASSAFGGPCHTPNFEKLAAKGLKYNRFPRRMEFAYDGGGLAKGGTVTLYVDGQQAGAGRVEQTEPIIFSADETCDVGFEAGSPVTYDYPTPGGKFSGDVNWVQIDMDKDAEDLDHLITPEERLRVAMAIQ